MPLAKDSRPASGNASVHVRLMCAHDLDAVASIAAQSPEASPWSRENYAQLLDEGDNVALVAEHAAGPETGVAGFLVGRVAGAEAEVLNLAVAANRRRCGYATVLLSAALQEFVNRSAECAFLEVRESNSAAIAFYEKNRFARRGLRKGYYRHPDEAAVIMGRELEG